MTPPGKANEEIHFEAFGQKLDLKGAATRRAPLLLSILATALAVFAIHSNMKNDDKIDRVESKVDKVLEILVARK